MHLQRSTDNLIKNAIEAAPRGTEVIVELLESDDHVQLRVHNLGDPIPPDVKATLFHPFSTFGKRGGTGLGIYGVKMAVEAMGGRVDYESGPAGTTFTIELPRNAASTPTSTPPSTPAPPSASTPPSSSVSPPTSAPPPAA